MSQNLSPRAGESPQRERKDSMKGEREDLVNHKEGRVLSSSLLPVCTHSGRETSH
jgi:hypothetical protein